ncbi:adenosylcobinamide-phosphate synthase CbiB [Citrobacter rodentium]|uniref:Cobalamin biosynthesis protein CobD n=2 Tax=Citrobacter rodentium TaxID=67825 RepID=D2TPQ2_CITRI|nr:adenosylcobinamide-phosphate synthase CbiB [Citrobacter rodentium]KIQ51489.1 cobalamin biosynthesis protein [Citrobacter rodentium]QBY28646.1 cobalamin biosynthesis protein [Citrobacter rodentium]UHO29484.1 adenosylcobinamide-phosphate synthase CbiB [Citrobacter rodentium NBRC 105723 = DSM 16636]CBG88869.1 cobalamin biosynthesis protein CbiB [Citrobacter rodentium ICC168]HAT8011890.1 cobalamin biosynthesis protein CobD [Citrobacter rodentium NBRC 105723 = DSM 16636]
MTLLAWCLAWCIDAIVGDPPRWPHPVRWIGNLINVVQRRVRRHCHSERALRIGGGVMWLVVVGATWATAWGVLTLARAIHPWLGWLVEVWMIFTVLAGRCLADAARDVERPLRAGDLAESRKKLSWIVGRDTSQLTPPQINRAVVETVAENTVDGVIAPLFFLLLGGAPLAMAYKAVNTLDSMVGYKNQQYRAIGMVSACLDDLANIIPARLGWLLLSAAAFLCRDDGVRALRIGWRDRYNHSSPNCAWAEAPVAGALGIRLGGPNDYFGERVEKPWIGDARRDISVNDISRTIRLMWVASTLALALFMLTRWLVVGGA